MLVAQKGRGDRRVVGTLLVGPGSNQVRNVGLVWRPGTGAQLAGSCEPAVALRSSRATLSDPLLHAEGPAAGERAEAVKK